MYRHNRPSPSIFCWKPQIVGWPCHGPFNVSNSWNYQMSCGVSRRSCGAQEVPMTGFCSFWYTAFVYCLFTQDKDALTGTALLIIMLCWSIFKGLNILQWHHYNGSDRNHGRMVARVSSSCSVDILLGHLLLICSDDSMRHVGVGTYGPGCAPSW